MKRAANVLIFASIWLSVCGFSAPAFGDDAFRVFQVEIGSTDKMDREWGKDFYVNGGKDDGFRRQMLLDVFRPKTVGDPYEGSEYRIRIFVGRLKITTLFDNMAIARIHSIDSSLNSPILTYGTVMVGDYVVPSEPEMIPSEPGDLGVRLNDKPSLMLPASLLFEFDQWHLTERGTEALSTVQGMFAKFPHHNIVVSGHTCDLGIDSYNRDLSMKRAQHVAHHLARSGIPGRQIRVEYYGEQFPLVPNDSEKNRRKNRRVEIRFIPPDVS